MEIKVLNLKGEEGKTLQLAESVFGVKPQRTFLHEVVVAALANRRRGTADTKGRGAVSGGGHKPWKQKHTGRARAGSIRSPLWRKGGIAFGPHPRSYRQDLPKAKLRMALRQALSARAAAGGLQVVEALRLEPPKTSALAAILKALQAPARSLLVLDQADAALARAGRNLAGLRLAQAADLNAYDVLNCRRLVMTEAALHAVTQRAGG